jgi:hypothetical protein
LASKPSSIAHVTSFGRLRAPEGPTDVRGVERVDDRRVISGIVRLASPSRSSALISVLPVSRRDFRTIDIDYLIYHPVDSKAIGNKCRAMHRRDFSAVVIVEDHQHGFCQTPCRALAHEAAAEAV